MREYLHIPSNIIACSSLGSTLYGNAAAMLSAMPTSFPFELQADRWEPQFLPRRSAADRLAGSPARA
jgi:hypothetical protein